LAKIDRNFDVRRVPVDIRLGQCSIKADSGISVSLYVNLTTLDRPGGFCAGASRKINQANAIDIFLANKSHDCNGSN